MYQLKVLSPNLNDFSVVLVKSSEQSFSVVCGLWSAIGGLPTILDIDTTLFAYASSFMGELQNGVTISADSVSLPLSVGNVYSFNGVKFVQDGRTPPDFDYELLNARPSSLTCGLCQDITINGLTAKPLVSVQSLLPGLTAFFPANDQFWLGIGQFPGLDNPQPGLLISRSIIQGSRVRLSSPPEQALGHFVSVDFSESTSSWVASFGPSTSSFQLAPA